MPRRPVDIQFGTNEKLWRRVESNDVKGASLKSRALRLQISVVRERHGDHAAVIHGKWNGIAEVPAGVASSCEELPLKIVCIDEPLDDQPGHALIAFTLNPGLDVPEDCG